MTTLVQFDAATQARATAVLNAFTTQYRVPAKLFRPEEIGAAVKGAVDAAGADESAFTEQLWGFLLSYLHRRMGEHAARGADVPSALPPSQYALLRKGLVARFGPLPDAPAEEEAEAEAGEPEADTRSADEQMAEMLRARPAGDAPIDPEVLRALRD